MAALEEHTVWHRLSSQKPTTFPLRDASNLQYSKTTPFSVHLHVLPMCAWVLQFPPPSKTYKLGQFPLSALDHNTCLRVVSGPWVLHPLQRRGNLLCRGGIKYVHPKQSQTRSCNIWKIIHKSSTTDMVNAPTSCNKNPSYSSACFSSSSVFLCPLHPHMPAYTKQQCGVYAAVWLFKKHGKKDKPRPPQESNVKRQHIPTCPGVFMCVGHSPF